MLSRLTPNRRNRARASARDIPKYCNLNSCLSSIRSPAKSPVSQWSAGTPEPGARRPLVGSWNGEGFTALTAQPNSPLLAGPFVLLGRGDLRHGLGQRAGGPLDPVEPGAIVP